MTTPKDQNEAQLRQACAELEAELLTNTEFRVEQLSHGIPTQEEAALEIVYLEYSLREERGDLPDILEYEQRFPNLSERLKRLINIHKMFDQESTNEILPEAATLHESQHVGNESYESWHIGEYLIEEEIARGGFGIVYRAVQVSLGRQVAIKRLRSILISSKERQRFRVEAEAVARLQHSNIVQIFEVGEFDGDPFLCLEYVAAGNLSDYLKTHTLDQKETAQLCVLMAHAVQYAHEQGVIHRDLKPHNVLIDDTGPTLVPKITDFGLAKQLRSESGATQTNTVLGTPAYMAPEQARNTSQISASVDVYSLGAVLYEMLTGRPPFEGDNQMELLLQLQDLDPVPPTRLRIGVSRDLETICLKCLEKEPQHRYESASHLADDLERYLQSRPITARPASAIDRCHKWARRRPALAGLSLVLVILAGLSFWAINSQRMIAEKNYLRAVEEERAKTAALVDANQQRLVAETRQSESERNARVVKLLLVHRDWESSHYDRAQKTLESFSEPYQTWEWRYLKRLCYPVASPISNPAVRIFHARFLNDSVIVGLGADENDKLCRWIHTEGQFKVQETIDTSGKLSLLVTTQNHRKTLFSALPKGAKGLLSNRHHYIYDYSRGELADTGLLKIPTARALANSRNLTADTLGKIRLRDLEKGDIWEIPFPSVGCCIFTRSDSALIVGTPKVLYKIAVSDGEVLASQAELQRCRHLATSLDDSLIAATGDDGVIALLSPSLVIRQRIYGHQGAVASMAFSKNGERLATVGSDRTLKVWDTATGREIIAFHGQPGLRHLQFNPAAEFIMGLTPQSKLHLIQTKSSSESSVFGEGFTALTPDSRWLIKRLSDQVLLYDWQTSGARPTQLSSSAQTVTSSKEGQLISFVGAQHDTIVYDVDKKVITSQSQPLPPPTEVRSRVKTIRNLPILKNRSLRMFKRVNPAVSDDGRFMVWIRGGACELFETSTQSVHEIQKLPALYAIQFLPDSPLCLVSGRKTLFLFNCDSRETVWRLPIETFYVNCTDATNDLIALGMSSGQIRIVHASTGELYQPLEGHLNQVLAVAFHPTENRLASVGIDRSLRIWDYDDGQEILSLLSDSNVKQIGFSADGHQLLALNQIGVARIFDATPLSMKPGGTQWMKYQQEIAERPRVNPLQFLNNLRESLTRPGK